MSLVYFVAGKRTLRRGVALKIKKGCKQGEGCSPNDPAVRFGAVFTIFFYFSVHPVM